MVKQHILNINGNELDTKCEIDRRIIGKYYENKFLEHLKEKGYNHIIKHPEKFNCYDFSELNGKNNNYYEQKSKLGLIENHNVSYVDVNKIAQYRQLIINNHNNDYNDANFYYINCFINPNNFMDYSFYYYKVDLKKIVDFNITTLGDSNTFIIPIEYFKPIDGLFKKLNAKDALKIEKEYNKSYQTAKEYDKFYTKPEIANKLIEKTNEYRSLDVYDYILEPSAGNGAISDKLLYKFKDKNNIIALDILPENSNILEYNFIKKDVKKDFNYLMNSNVLVIGNPPYSKQKSLDFIKQSEKISDTISFILPISFKKESYINKIPLNLHIIHEEVLPKNSFTIDKYDYDVKTMIMILEKRNYNRSKSCIKISKYFTFISCNKLKKLNDIDNIFCICRVGSKIGKIKAYENNTKLQSHYFIQFNNDVNIEEFILKYSQIDFKKIDCNNVAQKSISKNEIIDITNNI